VIASKHISNAIVDDCIYLRVQSNREMLIIGQLSLGINNFTSYIVR